MATRSILKNVTIKDRRMATDFINALENAENKTAQEVTMSKSVRKLTDDDVTKVLGDLVNN